MAPSTPLSHTILRFVAVACALWLLGINAPLLLGLMQGGTVGGMQLALALGIYMTGAWGAYGVWRGLASGFFAYAVFAAMVSLLLGQALIPYVLQLAPADWRALGVVGINGILVTLLARVQWHSERAKAALVTDPG